MKRNGDVKLAGLHSFSRDSAGDLRRVPFIRYPRHDGKRGEQLSQASWRRVFAYVDISRQSHAAGKRGLTR